MRGLLLAGSCLLLGTSIARADLAEEGNEAALAWSASGKAFARATASACAPTSDGADPDAWEAAQTGFADLFLAWQRARPWMVGPGASRDLASMVWFWPDPHGSAGRQISKALESDQLEGIAATGLGMAETILFEGTPEEHCPILGEVGRFQAELAKDNAQAFAQAALSESDRRRLLLISARDTLDRISQEKLARPLGLEIDAARGKRAEAWRSGLSLAAIAAALDGVEAIYRAPGGLSDELVRLPDGAVLDERLRARFAATRAALAQVNLPLDQAVADPDARGKVEALLEEVQALRLWVVERLAPFLGISLGFNALDGD